MRDQEMQLSELKKDNFGLKLRIYHLEEALRKQLGNDSDDWRLNIDLNVQLDSLKKDLQEKSELLLKAKHAMDGLSMQHEGHVKKLNQDFGSRLSEEKRRFQEALADKERDISELKKRCSKHEQAVSCVNWGLLAVGYYALHHCLLY
jgi:predicted  nucleic acid-binding Zn-ribbon protein